ncbi:MAG: hypothetical protein J6M39_09705 [Lachnospiraceae bacterium]|nr:hypothetical protein [Lachnospiraceae bacterium]
MEIKLNSKNLNIISLIGSIMTALSICFGYFMFYRVKFDIVYPDRTIVFIISLISIVCIAINKYNIVILIVGIINLFIATIRMDFAFTHALDPHHTFMEGFYLLMFGSLMTIGGAILWMKKNKKIATNVDNCDNEEKNLSKVADEKQTKGNHQYFIFGVGAIMLFMFIAYFSVGNWEQNYLGLWKYKRAWLFDTKGLNQINGKYYYFNDEGYMLTGKQIVNNEFHFFNEDGSAKEGWVQDGNVYHFCKEDGSIVKDTWIDTNNNISTANSGTFYLDEYGNMVAGQSRVLNGKTYEFDSQGYKMFTFKVTNVYFNTSSDSKEKMNALNIHQTVCCHYTIECDEYGAEGQIYNITYFPSGQSNRGKPFKCYSGDWVSSYTNGIYLNNADGPTGNLTVQFYDMKNRLIGQGSVLMIK